MKLDDILHDDILVFNEIIQVDDNNTINCMKGCYLYVIDDELKNYIKSRIIK